jgi:hypothetical protein
VTDRNRPVKKRKTMAGDLRHIASCLERMGAFRFAACLRAAAREMSEVRWENGLLRRKLKMKERK